MRRADIVWIALAVGAWCATIALGAFAFSPHAASPVPSVASAEIKPPMGAITFEPKPGSARPEPPPSSRVRVRFAPPELPDEPGTRAGTREAKRDLARGVLGWRQFSAMGRMAADNQDLVQVGDVLASDYRVALETHPGWGCIRPKDGAFHEARATAYNDVMTVALQKRYGENVLEIAAERASVRTAKNREAREQRERRGKGRDPCSPPTYVDRSGVQRVKHGCL
jgi:hypothetical protein